MCEVTSWTDEKRAGEKREEALGKKLWLKLQLFGTGLYLAFLLSKGWDVLASAAHILKGGTSLVAHMVKNLPAMQ